MVNQHISASCHSANIGNICHCCRAVIKRYDRSRVLHKTRFKPPGETKLVKLEGVLHKIPVSCTVFPITNKIHTNSVIKLNLESPREITDLSDSTFIQLCHHNSVSTLKIILFSFHFPDCPGSKQTP